MVSGLHPTVCWSPSLAQLRVIWEEAPHFTTAVPVLSSSTCNSLCLVIADMATVSISWASGFSQNMKPARQRETLPKFMPIIILLYKQSCCFALRKKKRRKKLKFWLNVPPTVENAHSTLGRCVKFTTCLLLFMHSLLKQAGKDNGVTQHAVPSALGSMLAPKGEINGSQ